MNEGMNELMHFKLLLLVYVYIVLTTVACMDAGMEKYAVA